MAEGWPNRVLPAGLMECSWIFYAVQQRERDQALASFTKGDYPLMFATDVAARGLDIKGVTHVFNFEMARSGSGHTLDNIHSGRRSSGSRKYYRLPWKLIFHA